MAADAGGEDEASQQPRLRAVLLELLERRGPGKTICPSDPDGSVWSTTLHRLLAASDASRAP